MLYGFESRLVPQHIRGYKALKQAPRSVKPVSKSRVGSIPPAPKLRRINMYKTEKRMEVLAKEIVDDMDMDALIMYANEQLTEYYKTISSKEFNEEWEERFN